MCDLEAPKTMMTNLNLGCSATEKKALIHIKGKENSEKKINLP